MREGTGKTPSNREARSRFAFPTDGISGQDEEKLEYGDTGLLIVDESLTIVDSAGVSELLSRSSEELVGSSIDVLQSGADGNVGDGIREALRTGEQVNFSLEFESKRPLAVLAVPLGEFVVVQLRDRSDFSRLSRELKRSRKILDTLDDGIYILDEAFVITAINDAVTEITGYSRDELVGSHASKLAGDETISMATEIIDQLRNEDSDVGLIESSIRTADGDSVPIETRFSTVEFANGDHRRVGLLRDVTERRTHEQTLQELNRSARQLLRANDEQTVCETIADVASTVWPDSAVVVYRYDATDTHLDPVVASDTTTEPRGPGTPEWNAFATATAAVTRANSSEEASLDQIERPTEDEDGEPTGRVIEREATDETVEQTLFASLEEHGLLTIDFGTGTDPNDVIESVELLAANAVAALGRVEREAELARRREDLAVRNDELERTREFNEMLRKINGDLVDATTLDDVASAVCEHLVKSERIAFVWFGETYRSGDRLQPVARAGDGDGYLDTLPVLGADRTDVSTEENIEPTSHALAANEPVSIPDVSTDLHDATWRERALVRGFQSVISVPIAYNDLTYGVVSVYADRQGAFDGNLGELLAELGETIGNAINGVETKRSLRSQSRVELVVRISAPDAVASRLAAAVDESVSVEGVVPGAEGRSKLYVKTEADLEPLQSSVLAVEEIRSFGESDRAIVTVTESTIVDMLADYGADVKQLRAQPETIEVTLGLPQSMDVRGLIEALEQQYSTAELLSRRDRAMTEDHEFSSAVLDRLTDRQEEVVETAYLSGYFEWPREQTGEEVAETLGITQPTFNRHLRSTEQNLFSLLFEDGSGE